MPVLSTLGAVALVTALWLWTACKLLLAGKNGVDVLTSGFRAFLLVAVVVVASPGIGWALGGLAEVVA
jgi:hypothetical protein